MAQDRDDQCPRIAAFRSESVSGSRRSGQDGFSRSFHPASANKISPCRALSRPNMENSCFLAMYPHPTRMKPRRPNAEFRFFATFGDRSNYCTARFSSS
jgi:hypothetical protein